MFRFFFNTFCHANLDSCKQQAIPPASSFCSKRNFQVKIACFFPAKLFCQLLSLLSRASTFANKRSLPTSLTTPDRLQSGIRAAGEDYPVMFLFDHCQKKIVLCFIGYDLHDYTPKEAHSRIFVTGGSVFARQMLAKKKAVLGAASLYRVTLTPLRISF